MRYWIILGDNLSELFNIASLCIFSKHYIIMYINMGYNMYNTIILSFEGPSFMLFVKIKIIIKRL